MGTEFGAGLGGGRVGIADFISSELGDKKSGVVVAKGGIGGGFDFEDQLLALVGGEGK